MARNSKPGYHGQQEAAISTLVPSTGTLLIIFSVCMAIEGKEEALLCLRTDKTEKEDGLHSLCVLTSGNTKTLFINIY